MNPSPQWRLLLIAVMGLFPALAGAGEEKETFEFKRPLTERPAFGESLSMLAQERDDYAKNLARYAANHIMSEEANAESLDLGRRLLAVALHLSPRCREALVVTYQLENGVLLKEAKKMDYSPEVFARLLLTRAELLQRQHAEAEKLLARCFIELAALIDPRNEDAVYAYQIQVIDHGALDWSLVTDAKKGEPEEEKQAP